MYLAFSESAPHFNTVPGSTFKRRIAAESYLLTFSAHRQHTSSEFCGSVRFGQALQTASLAGCNFDIGIRFKFTNYSVHIINKLFTVSALPIIQDAKHMMRA